jgi:pimeloyl-ACP methyl ester carboxylesterase
MWSSIFAGDGTLMESGECGALLMIDALASVFERKLSIDGSVSVINLKQASRRENTGNQLTSTFDQNCPTRVAGNGKPLLLIHGSGGDLDTFALIEAQLAVHFRVITYQRRAQTIDAADRAHRLTLKDHLDDALAVLDACDDHPAYVFGSSAGAVIALDLLSTYPDGVLGVIAHEPPLLDVLDDKTSLRLRFENILHIEKQYGTEAACAAFFDLTGILGASADAVMTQVARAVAARPVPPIREIHPVLDYVPDLRVLKTLREKLVLGVGTLHPDSIPVRATLELAKRLEMSPQAFPGNHFGYMEYMDQNDPDRFREILRQATGKFK